MNKLLLLLLQASLLFSGCTILKDDSQEMIFNPLAILFPEDSIFSAGELLSAQPRDDYIPGKPR